jgi:hypothetical protein
MGIAHVAGEITFDALDIPIVDNESHTFLSNLASESMNYPANGLATNAETLAKRADIHLQTPLWEY